MKKGRFKIINDCLIDTITSCHPSCSRVTKFQLLYMLNRSVRRLVLLFFFAFLVFCIFFASSLNRCLWKNQRSLKGGKKKDGERGRESERVRERERKWIIKQRIKPFKVCRLNCFPWRASLISTAELSQKSRHFQNIKISVFLSCGFQPSSPTFPPASSLFCRFSKQFSKLKASSASFHSKRIFHN